MSREIWLVGEIKIIGTTVIVSKLNRGRSETIWKLQEKARRTLKWEGKGFHWAFWEDSLSKDPEKSQTSGEEGYTSEQQES